MYIVIHCSGIILDENWELDLVLAEMPGHERLIAVNPHSAFVEKPAGYQAGMPVFIRGEVKGDRFFFEHPAAIFPENPDLSDVPIDNRRNRIVSEDLCDGTRFEISEAYPGQDPYRFWHLRKMLAEHFGCRICEIPRDLLIEFATRLSASRKAWINDTLAGMRKPSMKSMKAAEKSYRPIYL